MAAITSAQSGNWSATATWAGGVVPGAGDTATIANGHTVTVDADVSVGTLPADTTTNVLTIGGTAALVIAEDQTLTVRGNWGQGGMLTLEAGSSFLLDCAGGSQNYRGNLVGWQGLRVNGTVAKPCTYGGNDTTYVDATSYISGTPNGIEATHCTFQNLGSSGTTWPKFRCKGSAVEGNSVTYCTFDNCYYVNFEPNTSYGFTFEDNTFQNSRAAAGGIFQCYTTTALSNGTRDIKRNSFDGRITISAADVAFDGNYVAGNVSMNVSQGRSSFAGNFIVCESMTTRDGITDSYLFGQDQSNAHHITVSNVDRSISISGNVFHFDNTDASSDCIIYDDNGNLSEISTCSGNVFLPNASGTGCGTLFQYADNGDNTRVEFLHNTCIVSNDGGSGVCVGYTDVMEPGKLEKFLSNLFHTPSGQTPGFKAWRATASTKQDLIATANCDYNWASNLAAGSEGNGYQDYSSANDMFTVATSTLDTNGGSGDAALFDITRNVVFYDTAPWGLGNGYAPDWQDATAYVVGDTVSAATTGFYWGETINYRCIKAHTSNAADATDGKPGSAASWRTNWEYVSLYRLRESVDLIPDMISAVRQGCATTNASLQDAGHDGSTIGAVEYVDAIPSPDPTPTFAEALATWESNMLTYGAIHAAKWADSTYDFASGFYDAQRVFYNIADYTEDTDWLTPAETAGDAYRDQYVVPNGGVVTGYWNFTRGLYEDWDRNADASSKAALISLSENAAYAADGTALSSTEDADYSREVAYAINSYIDAERTGETHRTRMDDLIDQIIGEGGHFEQWFTDESDVDFAPFMFALSAEALINYYTHISEDADIITAIQTGADYIWANAWVADDRAFYYRMNAPTVTSADLNLLIAPVFAWLYWKTGNTDYRDAGDEIFRGGVDQAWLDGSKQFNQNYRWSTDYVTWRALGEAEATPEVRTYYPMSSTYPKYDATAESTWRIGHGKSTAGTTAYQGITGTAQAWRVWGMPLPLAPGTYTLSQCTAVMNLAADASCDGVFFAIFSDSGSTPSSIVTLDDGVTTWIDVTVDKPDSNTAQIVTYDLGDKEVTIEAGKRYFYAFCLQKVDGSINGYPGIRTMASGAGPGEAFLAYESVAGRPDTLTSTSTNLYPEISLIFKTAERKVFSEAYAAASTKYLPRRTDGKYFIKFQGAVVADGENFTCAFNYDNSGADGTRTTAVLDMGATDQVTFGGANVALAAAGAEAGDTFDLGVCVDPDTPSMNLFYLNRTTGQGPEGAADFATFSHAGKNDAAGDGSRNQVYAIADPEWLDMSGTAAVAAIEIGWEPVVLFGDSQASVNAARLGGVLPSAFTYDRIYWDATISGNQLANTIGSSHTAGYLRYKSATVGEGDLCEMTGAIFVLLGFGLNDVSQKIGATEANRNKAIMDVAQRTAGVLYDIANGQATSDNQAIIVGLPPYSDDSNASYEEGYAIRDQLNPMFEGLAHGMRCAYVNPWYIMHGSGVNADNAPLFSASFTSDAGTHYNAAGATAVSNGVVRTYEAGLLGGWWSNPARRAARKAGLLTP